MSRRTRSSSVAAFRHRDFTLFWAAAAVSNAGNWMQTLTVPYVVYRLTDSRTWLGVAALATFLPSIVGTMTAGAVVDRFERRRLLLLLQWIQMAMAVLLWTVWAVGAATIGSVLALAVMGGLIGGMVSPAWNSFVPLLVPVDELPSAIRLNSMQFSLARALGPLAAGAVLGPFGPGAAFMANAISFVFVIGVLVTIRPRQSQVQRGNSPVRQAIEGWRYVMTSRRLALAPVSMFVCGFFGSCFVQLASAIANEQFHRSRSAIGILVSSFGVGGIIGAVVVTAIGEGARRSTFVRIGLAGWVLGLLGLAATERLVIGLLALAFMGFAHVITGTTLQTTLQVQVDERYRGRALVAHMQGLLTGVAVGAPFMAWIADYVRLEGAMRVAAGAIATYAVIGWVVFARFRLADGHAITMGLTVDDAAADSPGVQPAAT